MCLPKCLLLVLITRFISTGAEINLENNACSSIEAYHVAQVSKKCYYNQDVLSDVPGMATRHGYKSETFTVTTSDGYILTIFRIISNITEPVKGPVFIQHGILGTSASWVAIGNRSLAFYLADRGYEVWLGNTRGSYYSNKHVSLSIDNPEYWDFDVDTIASIDIPTQLKFVFSKTAEKITYIGHSMGTSVIFMYVSSNVEAENYVKQILALAPIAYINDVPILEFVRPLGSFLVNILDFGDVTGLFYHEDAIHGLLTQICKNTAPELCYILIGLTSGKTLQFPPDDLLLYYSYWPGGISIYILKQYLQIIQSKQFQKFDYGAQNNQLYGTKTPPIYNLSEITLPTHLFYGENDIFYRKENIERLYDEIGSAKKTAFSVGADEEMPFDHIDFLFSENLIQFLYTQMSNILDGNK
ncbi:lipase member K-like [Tribolium madens]|uniref:lipase member K-like n=1 Tax=Tribolium madens TaxID=41895 RepID=UPI001CF761B4|nr:lipase member K-like [Tribolium madens]